MRGATGAASAATGVTDSTTKDSTATGSATTGATAAAADAADVPAAGESTTGAATEGAFTSSSTTAFECFAARAPEALEVLDPAFLVEGTAFADTTGSEGFNFLKTYSPEVGFGVLDFNYTSCLPSGASHLPENICIRKITARIITR
jgi:hypothetical protein